MRRQRPLWHEELPLNNPADHQCMMCEGPIHGALCGKLYCEEIVGNPSYKNPAGDLNDHAKTLANSHTALMCLHCVQHKLTAAAPTADAAVAAVDPPAVAAVDPPAAPPAAVPLQQLRMPKSNETQRSIPNTKSRPNPMASYVLYASTVLSTTSC